MREYAWLMRLEFTYRSLSPHRNGHLFIANSAAARAEPHAPRLEIEIGSRRWTWKIRFRNDSLRIYISCQLKIGAIPRQLDSSTAGHAFCRGCIANVNSHDLDTTNCLRWCLING